MLSYTDLKNLVADRSGMRPGSISTEIISRFDGEESCVILIVSLTASNTPLPLLSRSFLITEYPEGKISLV